MVDDDVLWSPETLTTVFTAPSIASNKTTMLFRNPFLIVFIFLFFYLYISDPNDVVVYLLFSYTNILDPKDISI